MDSLKYFLLRTVLFVVPFGVFLALGIGVILSAVYAAAIAFAVSYLFLRRERDRAAAEVGEVFGGRKQVRTSREVEDAQAEDALDDAQRSAGAPQHPVQEAPGAQEQAPRSPEQSSQPPREEPEADQGRP
ncbi:DUF4229 domain-containing protein [Sinomonas halotolerans]|uniref:DUF4229 domain-containing protein n=1 Tax=Sinomonas halotolerans TaxID=1644133 RepID=A0ABU9X5G4_9MICC